MLMSNDTNASEVLSALRKKKKKEKNVEIAEQFGSKFS